MNKNDIVKMYLNMKKNIKISLKLPSNFNKIKVILILGCSFFINRSFAQISTDSVSFILSGKQHKEWIASPWKNVMGSSSTNKCLGGESYIFYNTGIVDLQTCNNGLIDKHRFKWRVVKEKDDDFLYIDEKKYQIRPDIVKHNQILLRGMVYNKIYQSEEVILKYEQY